MSKVPTVDEYVGAFLTFMQAPLKSKTVFGQSGRFVQKLPGELVLYAPDGTPIRVAQDTENGSQIEHGEHLHAVVRPRAATTKGNSRY